MISVDYKNPTGCSTSTTPSTNTSTCFPLYWTPDGQASPILDWFDKYVVGSVTDDDNTLASASMVTTYDYSGPAWHYDDNEVVKATYRTYGQWRGFADVRTTTGETTDGQTLTDTRYFQGMDGDTMPGGTTRSATVSLSGDVTVPGVSTSVTDTDQLAGSVRESVAYRSVGGLPASAVVTGYWVGAPLATRTRTGLPDQTARLVRTAGATTTKAVTSGPIGVWRTSRIAYGYDKTTGLLRYTDDHGDIAEPEQETCTTTSYAPADAALNLIGLTGEVESDQGACSTGNTDTSNGLGAPTGVDRPTDVIADARTYYDTPAPTSWPPAVPATPAAPTVGNPTLVLKADGYSGGAFTYRVTSAAAYDAYGRTTAAWDALGNETTTAFTTANGQTTAMAVTNAKGQTTTSTIDPNRGQVTQTVDPNGATTAASYDALGRLTSVWLPGRDKAAQSANTTYAYSISQSVPSAVTTKKLNEDGGYTVAVQLYDGQLRLRQSQSQTPQGGRMVTDALYDSRGLVRTENHGYWDGSSGPTTTLVGTTDPQVTDQVVTTYDGLGRPVLAVSKQQGTVKEQVQTVYGGDRVTTIPLTGGTASAKVVDARGRTVETDAYQSTPTVSGDVVSGGDPAATTFAYDASGSHGQNTAITDPAGNQRTFTYDLLGRKTSQTDPDTGTTMLGYDADDRVATTTDARGRTLFTAYDVLGRKSAQYDGPDASTPKLADWTYDDPAVPNSIGRVTKSTHYDAAGNAYTQAVNGYNVHGQATKTTTTIPANVAGLAGSYSYFYGYTANLGLPLTTTYPAVGNLPSEQVAYGYNSLDMLDAVGGLSTYSRSTVFDAYGRVSQMVAGALAADSAVFTDSYDAHTGALTEANTTRTTAPQAIQDTTYTRNLAGQITEITDNRAGSPLDTQCFAYDGLSRLTGAWTATDDCAGAPTTTGSSPTVGGGDSSVTYWTSWTYDIDGNRKTQVQHGTSGVAADTVTTYGYGGPGTPSTQPDTLTSIQTTLPDGTVTGGAYTYDAAGDTASSTLAAGDSTFTWNDEGQLATLKSSAQSNPTTYTYDANGDQLLRQDPDGKATLFLSGQEVAYDPSLPAGSNVTATRYVGLPGGVTCVRTGTGGAYDFVASDDQATGTTSLTSTDQTPTFRLMDPYGNPRGAQPSAWPGDKGFVGGTQDATTGLTNLGAREYDPALGRFISPDPLFEATDPNQIGGYAYAGDDPVTSSDPTGLRSECGQNGDSPCGVHAGPAGGGSKENYHCGDTDTCPPAPDPDTKGTSNKCDAKCSKMLDAYKCGILGCEAANNFGLWCVHNPVYCSLLAHSSDFEHAVNSIAQIEKDVLGITAFEDCRDGDVSACAQLSLNVVFESKMKVLSESVEEISRLTEGELNGSYFKCLNSFRPDTKILMGDGTTEAVADIRPGDEVEAADAETGLRSGPHTVTARHVHHDDDLVDVTVETAGHAAVVVHTTSKHPFWDATAHTWVLAGDLRPGHSLETAADGHVTVTAVHPLAGAADMYNLTVDQLHTYYVLAGTTPVLVHNCASPNIRISPAASDWATKGAHMHVGSSEIRVFPTADGGVGFQGIRLSNGMASARDVEAARNAIMNNPELRADLIDKARSAMADMNDHNWGNSLNRAPEMNFLIKALEKIG